MQLLFFPAVFFNTLLKMASLAIGSMLFFIRTCDGDDGQAEEEKTAAFICTGTDAEKIKDWCE